MERTLKAVVRYDGTDFAGWQVQPGERTVQGVIEDALSRIMSQPIRIHGAGRTDAGVHALAQVFSFRCAADIPCERLRRSLSRMLGPAIRLVHIEEAPSNFHAQKSAVAKRYAYTLSFANEPDPFSVRYAWCVPQSFDPDKLGVLAECLVGEHDFAGFQGGGSSVVHTVRTVYSIELSKGGVVCPCDAEDLWRLSFYGNGFLYKMIRNITGTLVDIARGKIPEACLDERLASRGPYAGQTAPGHGLTLVAVEY